MLVFGFAPRSRGMPAVDDSVRAARQSTHPRQSSLAESPMSAPRDGQSSIGFPITVCVAARQVASLPSHQYCYYCKRQDSCLRRRWGMLQVRACYPGEA